MSRSSAIASIAILMLGFAVLSIGTNGGSIWTAESARRAAVQDRPYPLPDYTLRDTKNQSLSLATSEWPLTVVNLMYTNCPTVCLATGAHFAQLQRELSTAGIMDSVQLLSITFDPAHDDRAKLSDYLRRFGAVEPNWRAARFDSDVDLRRALDELGVVVIPEPRIGFIHNAAFYLIEAGRVIDIYDVDERTALFNAISTRLRP